MKRSFLVGILILVALGLFAVYLSIFTVYQTQNALVLRFGQAKRVIINDPGLHWKLPIDSVIFVDNRILDLNSPAQEVIASDQKRLVVDAFARFRITDPLEFYLATTGSVRDASSRLSSFLNSAVRRVLGDASFFAVVRDDRPQLMTQITQQVNREAQSLGITVVDVRIRRADLPQANSEAVFRRMQTEREQEAAQIRAEGAEEARRIRSRADRDATVIVAEANRDAEQVRGEGDAQRSAIFAEAYNKDPDFFAFYRSMQAYDQALAQQDTRFLLSPNSDFFRYFGSPLGNMPQRGAGGVSPQAGAGANTANTAANAGSATAQ